jgi:hypothetical protein
MMTMMMMMKPGTIFCLTQIVPHLIIRIPSYDEIINEDDEEFEKAEEFERKFNFRYQEPDAEFVYLDLFFCSLLMKTNDYIL